MTDITEVIKLKEAVLGNKINFDTEEGQKLLFTLAKAEPDLLKSEFEFHSEQKYYFVSLGNKYVISSFNNMNICIGSTSYHKFNLQNFVERFCLIKMNDFYFVAKGYGETKLNSNIHEKSGGITIYVILVKSERINIVLFPNHIYEELNIQNSMNEKEILSLKLSGCFNENIYKRNEYNEFNEKIKGVLKKKNMERKRKYCENTLICEVKVDRDVSFSGNKKKAFAVHEERFIDVSANNDFNIIAADDGFEDIEDEVMSSKDETHEVVSNKDENKYDINKMLVFGRHFPTLNVFDKKRTVISNPRLFIECVELRKRYKCKSSVKKYLPTMQKEMFFINDNILLEMLTKDINSLVDLRNILLNAWCMFTNKTANDAFRRLILIEKYLDCTKHLYGLRVLKEDEINIKRWHSFTDDWMNYKKKEPVLASKVEYVEEQFLPSPGYKDDLLDEKRNFTLFLDRVQNKIKNIKMLENKIQDLCLITYEDLSIGELYPYLKKMEMLKLEVDNEEQINLLTYEWIIDTIRGVNYEFDKKRMQFGRVDYHVFNLCKEMDFFSYLKDKYELIDFETSFGKCHAKNNKNVQNTKYIHKRLDFLLQMNILLKEQFLYNINYVRNIEALKRMECLEYDIKSELNILYCQEHEYRLEKEKDILVYNTMIGKKKEAFLKIMKEKYKLESDEFKWILKGTKNGRDHFGFGNKSDKYYCSNF